ncbi:MAG: hypothetical protein EXS15_08495 [Phycisphaerales bacterium]|nr:hypothetical protein [Phycisphaerales bacterium]
MTTFWSTILACCWIGCVQVSAGAQGELRLPIGAQPVGSDPSSVSVRTAAAEIVATSMKFPEGATRSMCVAWLRSDMDAMRVLDGSGSGQFQAICPDSSAVQATFDRLSAMIGMYGPPRVIIEAERPEHPLDLRLASRMQSILAERDVHAVDASAVRTRRRNLTDAAVDVGMTAEIGRSIVDRPDADFILRVGQSQKDDAGVASYGIQLHSCEITLSTTLIRVCDQSLIAVPPAFSIVRSESASRAQQESERVAVELSASLVLTAVACEWVGIADGSREWIVEIEGSRGTEPASMASALGEENVVVLENRPSIRALIAVSLDAIDRAVGDASIGTVIHRRPGYVLMSPPQTSRWGRVSIWIGVAGLATAFLLWRFRWRRSSRSIEAVS